MSFLKNDLGKFAGCGLIAAGGQKLLAKYNIGGLGADELQYSSIYCRR